MEEKQLSIFEKEMTVKEVAVALDIGETTVLKYIKKVFPGKLVSGQKAFLNETEVTAVKLKMQQNQQLARTQELPKTDLEKELLIQQAMQFQAEKIQTLQSQLEEAKPAIDFHKQVGDSEGLLSLSEVSKMLNTGRTRFCNWLRSEKIFQKGRAIPYQCYEERGYFEVKATTANSHVQKQTFITSDGLIWLQKRYAQ